MKQTQEETRLSREPAAMPEPEKFRALISASEDWLMGRILEYAKIHDYVKYTSTLKEAWRLSIAGLSDSLFTALDRNSAVPELGPDEDYTKDPIAAFGMLEAKRHRERGVRLDMFLGLMKYYKQSYMDLIEQSGFETDARRVYKLFTERFFDRTELGFLMEWMRLSRDDLLAELQDTNRAVTNEKNKYLTIFESLSNPVFLLDSDGMLENMNHAAVELFLGGRSPGSIYYSDRGLSKFPWLAKAIRETGYTGAGEKAFELETLTTLGMRSFEGKIAPMLDVSEKFRGTVVILNDVTERNAAKGGLKKALDELEDRVMERTRELQDANAKLMEEVEQRMRIEEEKERMQSLLLHSQKMEAIGTLAGGVAHDINNLLQVIMGNSQMLELKEGRNERAGEMIREIIGAAEQSAILVRQLLLFSRKQEMQFRRVDINKTVRDMMKMLGRVIGENIKVTLDLEDLLRQVMADAGSMEQVLMNLVLNSRDAMPERGAIRISTKNVRFEEGKSLYPGAQPGDFICLSVEDSGCGMSSDTIQRIFEPFFTTKPAGKGSGLGLSVVYGIVQKHGGWINVYSEQGHGTTFRIYIPTMKPGAGNGAAEETPAWSLAGQGENLLLVEDDAGVRSFTKAALRENGYNVRDAANAEEAIEIFSRSAGEIQCVITDVVLPGLSGLEMLEEMRAVRPDIRALFISGYIPNGDKWASMKERGAVMMPKPFSLGQLLSSVREVIHGGKGGI